MVSIEDKKQEINITNLLNLCLNIAINICLILTICIQIDKDV
jgi:hypothetical protein